MLFPSYSEGMPNAVLEAMACGVPVVTTKVGSLPDLIENGHDGFFTDIGDVPAMSNAVLRLLDDPAMAQQIGGNACITVMKKHDVEMSWRILAKALCRAAYEAERPSTILYEPRQA